MADHNPYAAPRNSLVRPTADSSSRSRWAWLRWLPGLLLIPPVVTNFGLALGAAHAMLGEPLNPGSGNRVPLDLLPLLSIEVAYFLGMGLAGAAAIRSWCGGRWWRAMLATTAYVLLAALVVFLVWLIAG